MGVDCEAMRAKVRVILQLLLCGSSGANSGTPQFDFGKSWKIALIMYHRDPDAHGRRQHGEIKEAGSLEIPGRSLETSRSWHKLEWLAIATTGY